MQVSLFTGVLVLCFSAHALGDEISLVGVGEPWRYYRGTNEPSAPTTAWRESAFDDSSWLEGSSGFSTTGYSDSSEATYWNQLPPVPVSRSFFLRHKFSLVDPSSVKWLVLRLDYNDGFVAYLNGHEILRRGLAKDPVAYDDYADEHPGGTAEEFNVSSVANLLISAENVLAIQVHTATTNMPGYANSMRLVPELLANFQRGPFVANATTNSIQIVWRTPVLADSAVAFGTNANLEGELADSILTTNHVVTVTGLQPGTGYFYRIRSTAEGSTALSPVFSFHTLKPDGDFSFLVTGDSEDGSFKKYTLASLMGQQQVDLAFHCGDNMYLNFRLGSEDYRCLSVYGRQMRSVPFYFSMGNHDINQTEFDQPFLKTFYLPTNSVTGTSHFYSFDHGDAHFAVLFLPWLEDVPELRPYQLTNGSPQYSWLTNDLAASTKPWKFLFMHIPFANSGHHSLDDDNNNGIRDNLEVQNLLLPIAQQYGVQIVFSGHEHDYERSNPMDGVYHVVIGGGGALQPIDYFGDGRSPVNSQFILSPAFVKVATRGDSLLLQAIGLDGSVIDSMSIQRNPPPLRTYAASWNTPSVEPTPGNDGFGNINGQTFDLVGEPIPALAGRFSNLGRIYVNNDATNLFIGLEQSMIYSNQNIFLFVESPRQTGVTNLTGLGDGVAGSAEGVDGLDFLENLSFTNFAPSVACLVGDEYADGQDRFFTRGGMDLQVGQGAFRLNSAFSDIDGVRVQQFNRSPQALLPPLQLRYPEQNANFIEIAIPFDQLGGLRPGDTIRIAAIVGLGGYDTNSQTRELDTGFLGSSMAGAGQSNVVLGAVTVQLAPAVLTISANDQIRPFGATNAPLTFTCTGFIGDDSLELLGGAPVLSTIAESNSPPGYYPLEISQGSFSNSSYSLDFINGILTIVPANTTLDLVSSKTPSTDGDITSLTATVNPAAPCEAIPTGIITFRTNGVALATVSLTWGQGISTALLPPGTNVVQAEYNGDDNFLGSTGSLQQIVGLLQQLPPPDPTCVLSIAQSSNNSLAIKLRGATNAQFIVLTSTNLAMPLTDWSTLNDSTNIATNGVWTYTLSSASIESLPASSTIRFFRVIVNPRP